MANMSHCRFINTLSDLRDCYKALDETGLSEAEAAAREALLLLCARIASDYAGEVEELQKQRADRAFRRRNAL